MCMNNKILSICIPTYNRHGCLSRLLSNIIEQLEHDDLWEMVEICISDNASNDGTDELVKQYLERYSNFKYHRNSENLGVGCNLVHAVDIASSEYCWFFGDDDKFEPGSIAKIINILKNCNKDLTGIVVNVQSYQPDLITKIPNATFRPQYSFYASDSFTIYRRLGVLIGFISSNIIKRSVWQEVIKNNAIKQHYSNYVYLFILANMVKLSPSWQYIHKRLVGWGSENDSALLAGLDGILKRMRLDYLYLDITSDVFGKVSSEYKTIANQVAGVYVFGYLQQIKFTYDFNIIYLLPEVTAKFWFCPNYYFKILPITLLPKFVINVIKRIKRVIIGLYH